MAHQIAKYGWIRDIPDQRDRLFTADHAVMVDLPPSVDLRPKMPPVFDQLELGSCTANATSAQMWYDMMKDGKPGFMPSRLFVYYNARSLEGTAHSDSGATIRDSIKSVVKWGFPPETEWAYDVHKYAVKPSAKTYKDALREKVTQYHSVAQAESQIKGALAQDNPVNFGFTVYESFESDAVAKSGIVPMPKPNETVVGGHAVLIVGYLEYDKQYIVRNSWGTDWGQHGYFLIPYDYVHNPRLAGDFWVVNAVP